VPKKNIATVRTKGRPSSKRTSNTKLALGKPLKHAKKLLLGLRPFLADLLDVKKIAYLKSG
jgi:hypothetical protein